MAGGKDPTTDCTMWQSATRRGWDKMILIVGHLWKERAILMAESTAAMTDAAAAAVADTDDEAALVSIAAAAESSDSMKPAQPLAHLLGNEPGHDSFRESSTSSLLESQRPALVQLFIVHCVNELLSERTTPKAKTAVAAFCVNGFSSTCCAGAGSRSRATCEYS